MAILVCKECGGKVSDKATKCPHCGAPVEISIKPLIKCNECGESIDATLDICPYCGAPVKQEKAETIKNKICPECGKTVAIDSAECSNCGYPFNEAIVKEITAQKNRDNKGTKKVHKQQTDNTFKCPTCGAVIHKGVTFCPTCKQRLCNKCGAAVKKNDKYCPVCNKKLPRLLQETWFDKHFGSIAVTAMIVIGICVIGGIVYGGYKFFGFDEEYEYTNHKDISYWDGTWSSPEGKMVYTFNSATRRVHVSLLNGIEYDKDYEMIPDGSGICFYEYNGECVSIINPKGDLYSKNLSTGIVQEVGIKLIHTK